MSTLACRKSNILQEALSFYKLVLTLLINIADGFRMPLHAECPVEFFSMLEHIVDDAMERLLITSQVQRALDGVVLDDFMIFIIMFMASPFYVKKSYLRAKMVEVSNAWIKFHRF